MVRYPMMPMSRIRKVRAWVGSGTISGNVADGMRRLTEVLIYDAELSEEVTYTKDRGAYLPL